MSTHHHNHRKGGGEGQSPDDHLPSLLEQRVVLAEQADEVQQESRPEHVATSSLLGCGRRVRGAVNNNAVRSCCCCRDAAQAGGRGEAERGGDVLGDAHRGGEVVHCGGREVSLQAQIAHQSNGGMHHLCVHGGITDQRKC